MAAVLIAVLAVLIWVVVSDGTEPESSDLSSSATPATTAAPDGAASSTDPSVTDSSTTTEAAMTSSSSTTGPVGPSAIEGLSAGLTETGLRFAWVDVVGEASYRYQLTTPDGAVEGVLPSDTVSWETGAACGTTVGFDLTAIDAEDGIVAHGAVGGIATGDCPTMWGPSNVRLVGSTPDGHVAIAWDHGAGQTGYLIQWDWVIPATGERGSDEAGIQGNRDSFDVPVPCGSTFTVEVIGRTLEIPDIGRAGGGAFPGPDCADVRYYDPPIVVPGANITADPGDPMPSQSTIRCPEGSMLVGGGFRGWEAIGAVERAWVTANGPMSAIEWTVSVRSPGSRSVNLAGTAVCLAGANVEKVSTRVEVSEGGTGIARASCPAGTTRTSGGWTASVGLNVLASTPIDGGWSVLAFDELGVGGDKILTASVLCVRDDRVSAVVVDQVGSVPYGEASPILTASCPAGTYLVGGGAASINAVYEVSEPIADRWQVRARNPDMGAGDGPTYAVTVAAVCLDVSP